MTVSASIGLIMVLPYILFISNLITTCAGFLSFLNLSFKSYKSSVTWLTIRFLPSLKQKPSVILNYAFWNSIKSSKPTLSLNVIALSILFVESLTPSSVILDANGKYKSLCN